MNCCRRNKGGEQTGDVNGNEEMFATLRALDVLRGELTIYFLMTRYDKE